jgi:hypothetical protein
MKQVLMKDLQPGKMYYIEYSVPEYIYSRNSPIPTGRTIIRRLKGIFKNYEHVDNRYRKSDDTHFENLQHVNPNCTDVVNEIRNGCCHGYYEIYTYGRWSYYHERGTYYKFYAPEIDEIIENNAVNIFLQRITGDPSFIY